MFSLQCDTTSFDMLYNDQDAEISGKGKIQPGAIVSNHASYIDILYHMSASFPSFVAKVCYRVTYVSCLKWIKPSCPIMHHILIFFISLISKLCCRGMFSVEHVPYSEVNKLSVLRESSHGLWLERTDMDSVYWHAGTLHLIGDKKRSVSKLPLIGLIRFALFSHFYRALLYNKYQMISYMLLVDFGFTVNV
jgi:hypothetical protein